jgi:hypothetical protein
MLSPISLIYPSFDGPCHGDARGMVCFRRRAKITEKVEGYLTPLERASTVGPLTTIPPLKNRECRISLIDTSFDAARRGRARGTVCLCFRTFFSRNIRVTSQPTEPSLLGYYPGGSPLFFSDHESDFTHRKNSPRGCVASLLFLCPTIF